MKRRARIIKRMQRKVTVFKSWTGAVVAKTRTH